MAGEKRALDDDVEITTQIVRTVLEKRRGLENARVVDQHVDDAETVDSGLHQRLCHLLVRDRASYRGDALTGDKSLRGCWG